MAVRPVVIVPAPDSRPRLTRDRVQDFIIAVLIYNIYVPIPLITLFCHVVAFSL